MRHRWVFPAKRTTELWKAYFWHAHLTWAQGAQVEWIIPGWTKVVGDGDKRIAKTRSIKHHPPVAWAQAAIALGWNGSE